MDEFAKRAKSMEIDILGLGESVSLHKKSDNITFGVNDIFRLHPVDYLVCVDKPEKFTKERLDIIIKSTPKIFFSQLEDWSLQANYRKIKLQTYYPESACNLDTEEVPKSVFSPFIAIALSYKLFTPTVINVYGVDMVTHGYLSKQSSRIRRHFENLRCALLKKGCSISIYGNGILV